MNIKIVGIINDNAKVVWLTKFNPRSESRELLQKLINTYKLSNPSSPPSSRLLFPILNTLHPCPAPNTNKISVSPSLNVNFLLLLLKKKREKGGKEKNSIPMAAAAPPIIPISTAQPPPPADTNVAYSDAAGNPSSAFRSFVLRISDSSRLVLAQRRSWAELLDRSSFARPASFSEATSRLRKNLPYYRINYLIIVASVLALSLVSHPGSLLLLLFLAAAWIFLYLFRPSDAPPISLFGRTFSDREIFGGLVALTIFVVFLTTVGSLIISAIMIGAALVAAHGSFHVPDDLFLDDQEPGANVGFLSFLGGIVPPASAQAVVAGR